MRLSNQTLDQLPAGIERPTYDRSQLSAGIVHIGLGNFHRAHQSWYLHRLMQQGKAHDWAIIGAGVRPYDEQMRLKLKSQDCLTTLIELAPSGRAAEVVGAMIDYLPIVDGNGPLIACMAQPNIRIVALTVTEGGYYIDPATGQFDAAHPDIVHDAAHPDAPRTAFGAMIAALKIRRDNDIGPFTGQTCDNIQGNGDVLRSTIVSLAKLSDPDLAAWIDEHCSFPNSMVDCIVPATGDKELAIARELGIDDVAPVTHENFRQWVIEDKFCAGRPPWEDVGVTITELVHDYEKMKIRVLNAGHQVLANIGELLSVETISGCMAHPTIAALFDKVEQTEIAPYVKAVPGMTPDRYIELIAKRFANDAIYDTTRRVAFDGSSRHPGFVLPILRDAIAAGGSIQGLALVEALWARMCAATREDGSTIEANDPFWDQLIEAAERAKAEPASWLDQHHIYGDLAEHAAFRQAFAHWLDSIWQHGVKTTVEQYCAN